MTYRETWEKAVLEGKGGVEGGRPWVDIDEAITIGVMGCIFIGSKCVNEKVLAHEFPCGKCLCCASSGREFFWPTTEPLPEVSHG